MISKRNDPPPMAISNNPQANVLKAPRSYLIGRKALIPAKTSIQRPNSISTNGGIKYHEIRFKGV
ncbi:hypothetical protein GWO18_01660 [Candidatus Bathyarchaeota archaeon]|nr:hypothetical protein [Candidatus Bathyarchaeota archaeon]